MAISKMQKVMIVAHRAQAEPLLVALQDAGIMQILDAETAFVTKEWPELIFEGKKPRQLSELVDRIGRAVQILEPFSKRSGGLLAPRQPVGSRQFESIAQSKESLELLQRVEAVYSEAEKLTAEKEALQTLRDKLAPWRTLATPLEQLGGLNTMTLFIGFAPQAQLPQIVDQLSAFHPIFQKVSDFGAQSAVIWAVENEYAAETQKTLRAADFESVSFEGLKGTAEQNIQQIDQKLQQVASQLEQCHQQLAQLAARRLELEILYDHHLNLYQRLSAEASSPATENVVFFEGWVKSADFVRLDEMVGRFDGCAAIAVEPAPDEEPPVEIDNPKIAQPFETVTRLYGMPLPSSVDPTVFLAPFFAIFFGLCVADAAYGLILTVVSIWLLRKAQGDKKILWLLFICSLTTTIAGALTGSWFADAFQSLLPQVAGGAAAEKVNRWREALMLFDPLAEPLVFIGISLTLGYIQVMFGLAIAFAHLLRRRDYAAAVFEKLTWLILLGCILVYALAQYEVLPKNIAPAAGWTAIVQLILIFWFTERKSGLAGRLGGGVFAIFSTVFYMGDMLSYVRLMALGMVSAGLGMAINILAKLLMDIPVVGFVLGGVLFVVGHLVNIALALLGAFVHSLRLQFVEFFPKFFAGGGREFKPLRNQYRYVSVVQNEP